MATNHGGVLDIIIEGVNGFFYPIGESEILAKKIIKSNQLNFDGYNYITNNFSLKNMVEKTIEVYKKVLNK